MTNDGRQRDNGQFAASDVDRIVRQVLSRLSGRAVASNGPISPVLDGEAELSVSERVVTAAALAGRLAGKRSVALVRGAVITPAARDLLREAKVELHFVEASRAAPGSRRLFLGITGANYEPASLIAALKRQGIEIEQVARVGLQGVVDNLVERIGLGGERALLFTDEPEVAACLSNRNRGVRAAQCGCVASVRRALRKLGANLVIVDPRGQSVHQLEQMARELALSQAACPGQYAQRLS